MKSWYKIEAKAESSTVYIYDEIGLWGITAKDFISELDALKTGKITLRINSPGGDVFDGFAIFNAIKDHPAQVNTQVDGLAASIASIIAMAGDEITIASNAFFMVHNAWAFSLGNADDMRKMADTLDKIDTTIVKTYTERTGQTQRDIRQMMSDETWLNADEAVGLGFADRIMSGSGAKAAFDLSQFRNAPKDLHQESQHTARDIEKALRDAGISKKAALATVSTIKRDVRSDTEHDLDIVKQFIAKMAAFTTTNKPRGV